MCCQNKCSIFSFFRVSITGLLVRRRFTAEQISDFILFPQFLGHLISVGPSRASSVIYPFYGLYHTYSVLFVTFFFACMYVETHPPTPMLFISTAFVCLGKVFGLNLDKMFSLEVDIQVTRFVL